MANYTTSADLIDDVLFRAGEPTDDTSDFQDAAVRYLNRAYQAIWSGGSELDPDINEVWWWIRKDDQGTLTLNPVVDSGTISVTNNSTSITFSSAPSASMAGRHFKVDDHADVFTITAHTAATTSATLDSVYTGSTNATASFRCMQLDYDLASDVLYLSDSMRAYQASRGDIYGIALSDLDSKWPLNEVGPGVPKNFAMIGQRKVRFSHYGGATSTELIKIDYEYSAEPADLADDSTEPLLPRQYRKTLADYALALLLEDKDDDRASAIGQVAVQGLRAMANENRRTKKRMNRQSWGAIHPRQGELQKWKGPLRTESGLIISM